MGIKSMDCVGFINALHGSAVCNEYSLLMRGPTSLLWNICDPKISSFDLQKHPMVPYWWYFLTPLDSIKLICHLHIKLLLPARIPEKRFVPRSDAFKLRALSVGNDFEHCPNANGWRCLLHDVPSHCLATEWNEPEPGIQRLSYICDSFKSKNRRHPQTYLELQQYVAIIHQEQPYVYKPKLDVQKSLKKAWLPFHLLSWSFLTWRPFSSTLKIWLPGVCHISTDNLTHY